MTIRTAMKDSASKEKRLGNLSYKIDQIFRSIFSNSWKIYCETFSFIDIQLVRNNIFHLSFLSLRRHQ